MCQHKREISNSLFITFRAFLLPLFRSRATTIIKLILAFFQSDSKALEAANSTPNISYSIFSTILVICEMDLGIKVPWNFLSPCQVSTISWNPIEYDVIPWKLWEYVKCLNSTKTHETQCTVLPPLGISRSPWYLESSISISPLKFRGIFEIREWCTLFSESIKELAHYWIFDGKTDHIISQELYVI